jgi:polar amino acid transport system substrate-binding protein
MMAPLPVDRAPDEWLIGTATTRPFVFYDEGGDLVGLDIDLATLIATRLGHTVRWVELPFAALIPALADGQVDVVLGGMYVTPEREAQVDFAATYARTGLVMVAGPGQSRRFDAIEDVENERVGVKLGATGQRLAQSLLDDGLRFQPVAYEDTVTSLLDLEVGRLDLVLNDYLNTLAYLHQENSRLEIVTRPDGEILFLSYAKLGIAVGQGQTERAQQIYAVVEDLRHAGILRELYQQWLGSVPDDTDQGHLPPQGERRDMEAHS